MLEAQVDTDCWDQLIHIQLSGSGDWAPCELENPLSLLYIFINLRLYLQVLYFTIVGGLCVCLLKNTNHKFVTGSVAVRFAKIMSRLYVLMHLEN